MLTGACGPLLCPRPLGAGEPPEALQRRGSAGGAEHSAGPLPGRRGVRPQAGPAVAHRAAAGEAAVRVRGTFSIGAARPSDGTLSETLLAAVGPAVCREGSLHRLCWVAFPVKYACIMQTSAGKC